MLLISITSNVGKLPCVISNVHIILFMLLDVVVSKSAECVDAVESVTPAEFPKADQNVIRHCIVIKANGKIQEHFQSLVR